MSDANVITLNDQNFGAEVLHADLQVLVFFSATWAGPCKAQEPIVDWIADHYKGTLKVGKVDIDESPNTTRTYGIRSVPDLVAFRGGAKSGQHAGLTDRETILKMLGLA
jgi:thioredoxin 1